MGKRYEVRRRNGHWQRRCKGQLHKGQWVNEENFRFRPENQWRNRKDGTKARRSECKACEYARRNEPTHPRELVGFVPISRYMPFMVEIKRRLGSVEAQRRIGVGHTTWTQWFNGSRQSAQRHSIYKLLVALREVRASGEVRSKRNIRRGAKVRGEKETPPQNRNEFYHPTGDIDLAWRNNYRKEHLEVERARERGYKRKKAATG